MWVLGIESSCDETAASVVKDGKEIVSAVLSSQIASHRAFGGVVPEIASRAHLEAIVPVIDAALKEAGKTLDDIDLIAVTTGPGLIGSLMVGVNAAKAIAWAKNIPLVAVNHVEAHLYAALMAAPDVPLPAIGVVLSGGHTALLQIDQWGEYTFIGGTIDDAIGEAFDKTARVMGLPYPGGPEIERLAKLGKEGRFKLKAGVIKGRPLDFSFSGLKTAALYAAKGASAKMDSPLLLSPEELPDLAWSFQEAAFSDVVEKVSLALKQTDVQTLLFGGGVTCNSRLRELFQGQFPHLKQLWPEKSLCLDNGAMIAGFGHWLYQRQGPTDLLTMEPTPLMTFGERCQPPSSQKLI